MERNGNRKRSHPYEFGMRTALPTDVDLMARYPFCLLPPSPPLQPSYVKPAFQTFLPIFSNTIYTYNTYVSTANPTIYTTFSQIKLSWSFSILQRSSHASCIPQYSGHCLKCTQEGKEDKVKHTWHRSH